MSIRNLEPRALWNHFADLNEVPRPSKKEEKVIQFMLDFGNALGLETRKDAIGNVVIKKNATPGMESKKTVILQSHLDMVHQKNAGTDFDFDSQGIEMFVNEDWVQANGTTLGADNGIGVATIMALLSSDTIEHPSLEAMFTIDEESGMTGAMELDASNFSGEILLNLDTEEDDELSIGCAGGIDTNTRYTYLEEDIDSSFSCFEMVVKGLLGGHSGMDIHLGLGNANKWVNRILCHLQKSMRFRLISIDGGGVRNAIPREARAVVAVHDELEGQLETEFNAIRAIIMREFELIEPHAEIRLTPVSTMKKGVGETDKQRILQVLSAVQNGVYRMSPDIEGLVETSSNLASVIVKDGEFKTTSLQRSSIESTKEEVATAVKSAFELMGCEVVQEGDYPGWKPNRASAILKMMERIYQEKFNESPRVTAGHAGLECGILLQHLPNVDMISFGPTIRGAHSPDEKVQISSVQKYWAYLLEVLVNIPEKD